ncbi:acyl-CoA carboxylase subunit epsilon [Micromonospora zhanjiangensis]|uniref:Acyl-CoA carboxylase subunit epsilon n=1 Tax=Micromonospora zhanjiangensis TaxID=1522057 RepID=A0ABV8KL02_9ACTN
MAEQEPVFRVVRGTPTAEELAALVGAIMTRTRPTAGPARRTTTSAWTRSARPGVSYGYGMSARPGPDGWRFSALPR